MKIKKVVAVILVVVVLAIGYTGFRFGPDLLLAYRQGFFENVEKHEYSGDAEQNLKALYTAMILYHESEGQFPTSSGWMDAIENRLNTADLKPGEAEKKLKDPRLNGDEFGFAMNDEASAKYKDDVKGGADTVLLFDSSDTSRNAHGSPDTLAPNPPRSGGRLAITVGGVLLKDGKKIESESK